LNFTRCRIGILGLVLVIPCFLIWFSDHQSLAAESKPEKAFLSIRADNETLRKVLKKISTASGYEIRFNTQLADEKIHIQMDNVTLNEALTRVLKPYNHMSLWDDANHIITLLIFQKNRPPVTLSGMNRIFELATETTAGP
jgi:hypothetical protein